MSITLTNKSHSVKQSELYDAYMLSIKDEMEAHDTIIQRLTKEYNDSIEPDNINYQASIEPEYIETAKIVNPEVEKLKAKLEKIRIKATKQTNDELDKFNKWKNIILADLEPRIADRLSAFKEKIKDRETAYNAECERLQKEFETKTMPQHAAYVKEAEKLEAEFSTTMASFAKDHDHGHELGVN